MFLTCDDPGVLELIQGDPYEHLEDMMEEPRSLSEVYEEILRIVPEDQEELRASLESAKTRSEYAAPELMRQNWMRGKSIMEEYLGPPPLSGWKELVRMVWMGESGDPSHGDPYEHLEDDDPDFSEAEHDGVTDHPANAGEDLDE